MFSSSSPFSSPSYDEDELLLNLNASQRAAVSCPAATLAILAGPGSGKTHTLTARTAWLLRHERLRPSNVIVATFTVKAAREMRERIDRLLAGDGHRAAAAAGRGLVLGTFHSIARRYLARYGHLIGVPRDFAIADAADSLAIIKRAIKRLALNVEAKSARARISSGKAKGVRWEQQQQQPTAGGSGRGNEMVMLAQREFETLRLEYQAALARANMLDYDDLLLRCVELLTAHPACVSNVEAVLIDEFQDTNVVQFELMRLFAARRRRVTIVGDPDQSIYGFRSAEMRNFARMLDQYPETVTVPLEENYRSSGAILLAALEVIQQDQSRIAKSLLPTHNVGTKPVLRSLPNAEREAQWIVLELRRVLALSGDMMNYGDVAVLLRSAALSRLIESELGKAGVPYRMVGGHKFYDRVEVKTLLDYLRVINKVDNSDAVIRALNTPSRRIGEVTIKSLVEKADQTSTTLWNLISSSIDSASANVKLNKQTMNGLSSFMEIILACREKLSGEDAKPLTLAQLLEFLIKKLDYKEYLLKQYPKEHDTRWANVEELITQAKGFVDLSSMSEDEEALPEIDGLMQEANETDLTRFLANIALASEVKDKDDDSEPKSQVTLSTIHAAKGLEWPVVFIPAVYQGSIPHSRAEDQDEERRLLYVAMTRAKALLYLSCPSWSSRGDETNPSPFLETDSVKALFEKRGPRISSLEVTSISQTLRRVLPSLESIAGATASLPSVEDDFPRSDASRYLSSDKNNRRDRDGRLDDSSSSHHHHYEQASKRQRLDDFGAGGWPGRGFVPVGLPRGYSTTMSNNGAFSTASTTMGAGFVSAGSHLKVLSENSVNTYNNNGNGLPQDDRTGMKSRSKQQSVRSSSGKPCKDVEEVAVAASPNISAHVVPVSRTMGHPNGHSGSIVSFFCSGNKQGGAVAAKGEDSVHAPVMTRDEGLSGVPVVAANASMRASSDGSCVHDKVPAAAPVPRNIKNGGTSYSNSTVTGIQPALADHKLPALRQANRQRGQQHARRDDVGVKIEDKEDGEAAPKFKPYVFLSSSPPRCSNDNIDNNDNNIKNNNNDAHNDIAANCERQESGGHDTRVGNATSRPAQTMHTTSVGQLQRENSINNASATTYNKRLGMRRSVAGWQGASGRPFAPPTMLKRGYSNQ